MQKPEPIKYETEYKTVVVETPRDIKTVQGIEVLDGGIIFKNGKEMKFYIRIDNKPELSQQIADWKAAWASYNAYKAAEFAANVPGLEELEKAQDAASNEDYRYSEALERMMEDENGTSPAPRNQSLSTIARNLAIEYPRAAMYLKAKDYTLASNFRKYAAGQEAMEIIATGGTIEEAEKILNNWCNEID